MAITYPCIVYSFFHKHKEEDEYIEKENEYRVVARNGNRYDTTRFVLERKTGTDALGVTQWAVLETVVVTTSQLVLLQLGILAEKNMLKEEEEKLF